MNLRSPMNSGVASMGSVSLLRPPPPPPPSPTPRLPLEGHDSGPPSGVGTHPPSAFWTGSDFDGTTVLRMTVGSLCTWFETLLCLDTQDAPYRRCRIAARSSCLVSDVPERSVRTIFGRGPVRRHHHGQGHLHC